MEPFREKLQHLMDPEDLMYAHSNLKKYEDALEVQQAKLAEELGKRR